MERTNIAAKKKRPQKKSLKETTQKPNNINKPQEHAVKRENDFGKGDLKLSGTETNSYVKKEPLRISFFHCKKILTWLLFSVVRYSTYDQMDTFDQSLVKA